MTSYRRLFILVEGDDDERFFKKIIIPELQKQYNTVSVIKHAAMKKKKVDNLIKSIKAMNADYMYFKDIDNFPCVTSKKEEIQQKHKHIDPDKIIIVIREIEAWYLAGLTNKACTKLKISNFMTTDNITKEKFNSLIPKKFTSRINFMLEILKIFSIKTAKSKNKSFKYFLKKYRL